MFHYRKNEESADIRQAHSDFPEARGGLFWFKKEPRHSGCLAPIPLCPHTYYIFSSTGAGKDPIHLCISNLGQTHIKSLAKVCYMKV